MTTFDNISGQYKEKSLVQQKAALKLLDLLKVGSTDSAIDVACGPGHITNLLSKVTSGKVIGIDISDGMIKQARALYPGIEFRQIAAEDLDYNNEFDIAFCNSALPWFRDPAKAIKAIFRSELRGPVQDPIGAAGVVPAVAERAVLARDLPPGPRPGIRLAADAQDASGG
ncbi:MAG: class I SAM-dependent methyltransferase, partial [Candidatus Methanoperedens sp.]|nr:class I SAM-dependent methyltransferase [Candidatus Methanoperedens sp.]